jgi:outer membrane murein-binding lipoprotein Lpp
MVYRLLAALILALWVFGGCAKTTRVLDDFATKIRLEADSKTLEKGFEAIRKAQYAAAQDLLQNVSVSSGSYLVRRRAAYGLAVSRLLAANSSEQFQQALVIWQKWRQSEFREAAWEDPALLEPFLMCRFPPNSVETVSAANSEVCRGAVAKSLYEEALKKAASDEKNLESLKKKYDALNAEKEVLIQARDSEIQILKDKIKALEAIDQKIQQKKTEISSPQ